MNNVIDITALSDNALEAVLASRTGAVVDVDHLTRSERHSVARALGWDKEWSAAFLAQWCSDGAPAEPRPARDYEGAILDRQQRDAGLAGDVY